VRSIEWANSGQVTPQWKAEIVTESTSLELGQGVYRIGNEKITFRPWRMIHDGNSAFIALAYLLQTGKLDRIRQCSTCSRFFFARDTRENVCGERCGRTKDSRAAPSRARRARTRRAETEAQIGLPQLIKLSSAEYPELRKVFGDKWDDFLAYAEKLEKGAKPANVWKELPPRLKKPILVTSPDLISFCPLDPLEGRFASR
jgi:hypothetical protein